MKDVQSEIIAGTEPDPFIQMKTRFMKQRRSKDVVLNNVSTPKIGYGL